MLEETRIFQNYSQDAEIIHLLLITDEGASCVFFQLSPALISILVMDSLDEPGDLIGLAKNWETRPCVFSLHRFSLLILFSTCLQAVSQPWILLKTRTHRP